MSHIIKPVEYFVRIEWSKPSFMQFLGHVPADYYKLFLVNENEVCGVIVGTEVMEYVTNEISLKGVEYICDKEYLLLLNTGLKSLGGYFVE